MPHQPRGLGGQIHGCLEGDIDSKGVHQGGRPTVVGRELSFKGRKNVMIEGHSGNTFVAPFGHLSVTPAFLSTPK